MDAEALAAELLTVIRADGQARVRPLSESGYESVPFGVQVILPTRAVLHLQAVTTDPTGHSPAPRATPPAADPVTLPTAGPTRLAAVERWLGNLLQHTAPSAQIATVRLFQHRNGANAVPYGLALTFTTGGRGWVYLRHCTPAGREPGAGPVWWRQAAV